MKNITEENIYTIFEQIIGPIKKNDDDEISYKNADIEKEIWIEKKKVKEALTTLEQIEMTDEIYLIHNNYYEIPVKEASGFIYPSRGQKELFCATDIENKIEYKIGAPSFDFIIYVLDKLMEDENYIQILHNQIPRSIIRRRLEDIENDKIDLEEYFRNSFFRNQTMQIRSEKEKTDTEYDNLVSAYIFQISYNYNYVLVPQKNISDFFRRRVFVTHRRNRFSDSENEFDPPRRKYVNELVSYYQMALASDNPYMEYISYYHILEFFFDTVFNEDLVEKIRNKITLPTFSYKRKKDILDLAKMITRANQMSNDGISHNELSTLTLTLKKYINLEELKNELIAQDINYIDFLKTQQIAFSNGDCINLNNNDADCVFKEMTNRIYKTRNALVHSKELETSKYKPFHDDKILLKEIPLIRSLAEQMIIKTSQVL